jgi:exodeoxyribonuclease-3
VTLNIGVAASPRAARILKWLARRADDVVVLTETNGGDGSKALINGMLERGYIIQATPTGSDRGVVVASRVPVVKAIEQFGAVTLPWRVGAITLDTEPRVNVVGVYVPSRDRSAFKVARKREFIASFMDSVRALTTPVRQRLLIVGDLNVIPRRHQPRYGTFFPYEYAMHDQLEDLGFAAAHDLRSRRAHPHSWIGRTGNGYLYDYVHVGEGLQPHVERCMYLHAARLSGLSDHAAVAVRLKLARFGNGDEREAADHPPRRAVVVAEGAEAGDPSRRRPTVTSAPWRPVSP